MTVLRAIRRFVAVVMRQLLADRTALFFFVVLPIVVIVVIGSTFGSGGSMRFGIVGPTDSVTGRAIEAALDGTDGVKVTHFASVEDVRRGIRRQVLVGGVVLPPGLDTAATTGEASIELVIDPTGQTSQAARDVFDAAITTVFGPIDAARFAAGLTGVPFDQARTAAADVDAPAIAVTTIDIGDHRRSSLSAFSLTAPQNLVLFVFINSMAAGASLVRMRTRGVLRRVLAGPVGTTTIVAGLTAAWFALSVFQSVLILAVGRFGFDVDWGDPLGAALLTVTFALVGTGAGLLVGALFHDEDRLSSISPPIGIVLGALGGCMVPLEVFPTAMRTVARVVPHYWAMTAWQQLIFDGDRTAAIAVPLLVLVGFAIAFLGLAVVTLRNTLVRG